jgi:hypothetical protein
LSDLFYNNIQGIVLRVIINYDDKNSLQGERVMCIFCGGCCGGVGDMLLPTLVVGTGLVVTKIKVVRDKRKERNKQASSDDRSSGATSTQPGE